MKDLKKKDTVVKVDRKGKDVAIVGMSCRFPDARDYRQYWSNLAYGVDSVKDIGEQRWNLDEFFSLDYNEKNKSYTKWGGLIDNLKEFDAPFFNIGAKEAESMDPQQRILLEEVQHCIDDSGIDLNELRTGVTSVYVGVINQGYDAYAMLPETEITSYANSGICDCILANRVSYYYGFSGNSIAINTGCSASLVALHQAKVALQSGECDYAIVAGININILPIKYISGSKARMLSPTGKCKTFDKDADGYVPGEGIGVVVLQRLQDAQEGQNNIHGVLKGSSVNHVGNSNSLTAPSVSAQRSLIIAAYEDAGISTDNTNYVEAHGTGTSLGDPIEVEALTQAFHHFDEKNQYCYLGSVKANIGHLEPAAGIASLVKVMLMMKHYQIPPQINFNTLNPVIILDDSPFKITKNLIPWNPCSKNHPLTAGISSFGFGGSNAHVVVQEYVNAKSKKKVRNKKEGYPFLLSAKSQKGLNELKEEWLKFIDTDEFKKMNLNDICLTLLRGRELYNYRLEKNIENIDEIKEFLQDTETSVIDVHKNKWIMYINYVDDAKQETIASIIKENSFVLKQFEKACKNVEKYLNQKKVERNPEVEKVFHLFCLEYSIAKSLLDVGFVPHLITADTNHIPVALCLCQCISFEQAIEMTLNKEYDVKPGMMHPHIPYYHLASKKVLGSYTINDAFLSEIISYEIPDSLMEVYQNRAKDLFGKQYTFTKAFLAWNEFSKAYDLDVRELLQKEGKNISDKEKKVLFVAIVSSIIKINKKWELEDKNLVIDNILCDLLNMFVNNVMSCEVILMLLFGEEKNYEKIKHIVLNRLDGYCKDYVYLNRIVVDEKEIENLVKEEDQNDIINQDDYNTLCFDTANAINENRVISLCESESYTKMLGKLCSLGSNIDWNLVYQNEKYQKVSLVNYPFDHEKSYWIGTEKLSKDYHKGTKADDKKEEVNETRVRFYSDDTFGQVCEYFNQILCELLKREDPIELDEEFREMGIDSIAINEFNSIMSQKFGEISQMIMFECVSLQELAEYFVNKCKPLVEQIIQEQNCCYQKNSSECMQTSLSKPSASVSPVMKEPTSQDIAIIGLSGEFAGCDNVEELWRKLLLNKDLITEIPIERWDYRKIYSEDAKDAKNNKIYCKYGSFLNDIDKFDPLFFKLSPNDSEKMDPQERRFLQTVWHTFEDAGYGDIKKMDRSHIGIFVGLTTSLYALIGEHQRMMGNLVYPTSRPWSIANRASYVLDLHGPSIAVDTACASSLTSFHLACESILSGESTMAIAGGVNMHLHNSRYVELCQFQMLSPTGHCHSFSEEADGFVPGEGCGAVLLKPLSKAIEDKDNIYAVVKATALNHSGLTSGYAVPSADAQADVIDMALKKAGISARTISAVEAHGTGTRLGDPLEINGLAKVFHRYTTDKNYCSIGSIKSNIGHCEGAAGIASITKAILELRHKKRLPIYGLDEVNRNINFEETPFYPQMTLSDWERIKINHSNGESEVVPRRIEVSCFGAGGVNVSAILEEYEERDRITSTDDIENIFVCSAKSENRLLEYVQSLFEYIEQNQDIDLSRILYTLQSGREAMNYRLAIKVKNYAELIDKLTLFLQNKTTDVNHDIYVNKVTKAKLSELTRSMQNVDHYVDEICTQRNLSEIIHLWVNGCRVDWKKFYSDQGLKKVSLPTYPFEKDRYWVPILEETSNPSAVICACNTESSVKATVAANQLAEISNEVHSDSVDIKNQFIVEIKNIIANISGTESDKIELENEFSDYGFDSLTLKDFTDELEKKFHIVISPTLFFSFNGIQEFVEYLLSEHKESISKRLVQENPSGVQAVSEKEISSQYISEVVLQCISEIAKVPVEKIDLESELSDYGFDSITLGELAQDLNEKFGIEILPTVFFTYDSISSFTKYLIENYGKKLTIKDEVKKLEDIRTNKSPFVKENKVHQDDSGKIAIVGVSVTLPNADNKDEYWDNMIHNRSCISEVPKDRWNWEDYYSEDKNAKNKTISKWGGFVKNASAFDAKFFNISPYEAEYMDPQQRKILETVWHAVEDSGYCMDDLSGHKVGVFVSTENCDYRELLNQSEVIDAQVATGSSNNMLANRISYSFDFHGPSEVLDSACSGSLSAINRAIDAITLGECECAIAGGVRLMLSPNGIVVVSKMGILAPDGKCKTFDKSANGYVKGEGVGAILLKPLTKAISDGDYIYGVIAGRAVNHGGKSRSVTAPNAIAQSTLISDAIENANLNPEMITYIETHGTGTELGDPIEIEGLTKAFQRVVKDSNYGELDYNYCGLGSVKTNTGHLENMSGIASIVKVLLAMKYKMIPATINFKELNPLIKLDKTPFYIVDKNKPWVHKMVNGKEMPFYAGVSSFGFGGSNVHLIIESYENNKYADNKSEHLFVLSAKDHDRLQDYVSEVIKYIEQHRITEYVQTKQSVTMKQFGSAFDYVKEEIKEIMEKFSGEIQDSYGGNISLGTLGFDEVIISILTDAFNNYYGINLSEDYVDTDSTIDSIAKSIVDAFPDKINNHLKEVSDFNAVSEKVIEQPQEMQYSFSFSDFIYTYQVGRTEFGERLAIVANSAADLYDKLNKYINTKANTSSKVFVGSVKKQSSLTSNMENVSQLWNSNLEKIAQLWCSGETIQWKQFYQNKKRNRIPVPGYPFAKTKYWVQIPENKVNSLSVSKTTRLHPLIDTNISTLHYQEYQKTFYSSDSIVSQHIVNGQRILPGAAHLEMARMALRLATESVVHTIGNVYWLSPICVDKECNIYIQTIPNSTAIEYQIYSFHEEEKQIHSKGIMQNQPFHVDMDVVELLIECNQEVNTNQLYDEFDALKVSYGKDLRTMKKAYINHDSTCGYTKLEFSGYDSSWNPEYVLNPILLDGIFQSTAILIRDYSEKAYVPFCMKGMNLIRPIPNECMVFVKSKGNYSKESCVFDIIVTDAELNEVLIINGFSSRITK